MEQSGPDLAAALLSFLSQLPSCWLLPFLLGGGSVSGFVWWLAGKPSRDEIIRWLRSRRIRPGQGEHFTFLVADLAGDDPRRSHAQRLAAALRRIQGTSVIMRGLALRTESVGDHQEAEKRAEEVSRSWLQRCNADILIWGDVDGDVLRLRFFSESEGGIGPIAFSFPPTETELPENLWQEVQARLAACALHESMRRDFADEEAGVAQFASMQKKIRTLVDSEDRGKGRFHPTYRSKIFRAQGLAFIRTWEQTNESYLLSNAEVYFSRALGYADRDSDPFSWAAIQSELAWVLYAVALNSSNEGKGVTRLKKAVTCHEGALEYFARSHTRVREAKEQERLGKTLHVLFQRTQNAHYLRRAVVAYRAALDGYPRNTEVERGRLLGHLGSALGQLGELESDPSLVREGADLLRESLQILTDDRDPKGREKAQHNLDLAVSALKRFEHAADR